MPDRDDTPPIPHDLHAEHALLGTAALGLSTAHHAIHHITTLPPGAWYKPTHRHIADAITTLATAGHTIDLVTLADQLRTDGLLDHIGGTNTLIDLTSHPSVGTDPDAHARILADLHQRREVLNLAHQLRDLANTADPGTAVLSARDLLDHQARTTTRTTNLEIPDIADILAGNLDTEPTTILTRTDGLSLLYPGRLHSISAEPESGKSWIALAACAEVIAAGGAALYVDWEDTPAGVLGRMLALGTPAGDLIDRFAYVRPLDAWGPAETAQIAERLDRLTPDLAILDGIAEALQRDSLDENSAPDWVNWAERVARPIARTGTTVVMLDHVVKRSDDRGRYGRGTGAKLASIDGAAYDLKVIRPFSRNESGAFEIIINKDRPGYVRRDNRKIAVATLTPHGAGATVEIEIHPPESAPQVGFRPTEIMEQLSQVVELGDIDSKTAASHLPSKVKHHTLSQAVAALTREGYIEPRRNLLHSVRPFRRGGPTPEPTDTGQTDLDF